MIIVSHLGAVHLNDYVYFKCARLLVVLQVAFQFLLLFGSEGLHIIGVIIMTALALQTPACAYKYDTRMMSLSILTCLLLASDGDLCEDPC
jgi:hypothetical protein